MEDTSGVLGASGMLRRSPSDQDDPKTAGSDKTTEEIDVEGNSDTETGEVGEKPSQMEAEPTGKLTEQSGSCSVMEGVSERLQESPSDQKSENGVSGPIAKPSVKAPEPKMDSKQPNPRQGDATWSANEKQASQTSGTDSTAENGPGPSSVQTSKGHKDGDIVQISGSGLVTVSKAESNGKTIAEKTPPVTQLKEKRVEPEAPKPVRVPQLKSFEDAFKASLEKLAVERSAPKKVTGHGQKSVRIASSRPASTAKLQRPQISGVVDLTDEEKVPVQAGKRTSPSFSSSKRELPVQPQCTIDLTSSQKSESSANQPIDVDASDEEADDAKDIENFSSDSSSTIIDVELAAKESTEEEIPGSLSESTVIPRPCADSKHQTSKSDKAVIREETDTGVEEKTEDAKADLNPTSDTKLQARVADKHSKDDREAKRSDSNEDRKRESQQSEQMPERAEARLKKSSGSIGNEEGKDRDSTSRGVAKQKADNSGDKMPSKSQDVPGKKTSPNLSEMKLETKEDRKARHRERSKSDESHIATAKKYQVSKQGIILQPGTKLEAMDYSKKWYVAKIVSVDESDNTVLIHFDGWNSRFDEWLEFDSDRLRPLARVSARRETAKEVKTLGGYKVGDEVLARWSDCRYYPAKILGMKTNGSYRVLFYDGIEKTVMGINVRDMPDSLKSQRFFSNLEHQFRALVNKKRKTPKDADGKSKEGRYSKGSTSGSRSSSPVQPAQRRRHPSASQQTSPPQPAKRSRQDPARGQRIITHKGQRIVSTPEPVPAPAAATATTPQDPTDLLPSPTSSEASELMSALEHGMMDGKKRYREPLIFDKNSGLIRDPRRLVAPKELVIDLDHNKYKCDVPDCGKAFRKASLLEYHKKYYHISKPTATTSALTAAKNAVTRSRKRLSTSTMASGSSKVRRTESLDRSPAKVASRPMRTSAPSVLTVSQKRPLPSPKPDAPTQAAQPARDARSSQVVKRQPSTEAKKQLSTPRTDRPTVPQEPVAVPAEQQQASTPPKVQESEVVARVSERSRRVSGSALSKDDKPSMSKWEVVTTSLKEKVKLSPKLPAPSAAAAPVKEEQTSQPPPETTDTKPEASVEPNSKSDLQGEVKDHAVTSGEVAPGVVASGEVPKKDRRSRQHKKHKRHKTRSRERRSREQSRSDRRRAAERAKQRRLEQRRKESPDGNWPTPENVMEWTAKYLPPKVSKNLPQSPAQSADDLSGKQDTVDSSTAEEGGPREMIRCLCRNQEEEGFMIQCESCFGWQHGACVRLTEHTVPKQYVCSFCVYPENLRTHARHRYNQDWFQTGRLPHLVPPKELTEGSGDLTDSMLKTHQLMADMINVTEALDKLQHKIEILKSDNHPDLKLWAYHWGLKDEAVRDKSSQNQQPQSSLENTDLQQTSAEASALTESMRSDVPLDGVTQEIIVQDSSMGTSETSKDTTGPQSESGGRGEAVESQEGARSSGDGQTIFGTIDSVIATNQDILKSEDSTQVLNVVNVEDSLAEPNAENPQQSSSLSMQMSTSEQQMTPGRNVPHVPFVPDNSALMSLKPQEKPEGTATPTGKPTVCFVPDAETSTDVADDMVTGEPGESGMPQHDGKADSAAKKDGGESSDDEPLIKYSSKPIIHSTQATEGAVTTQPREPGMARQDGKDACAAADRVKGDSVDMSDDEPLIKYTSKPGPADIGAGENSALTPPKEAESSEMNQTPPAAAQAEQSPSTAPSSDGGVSAGLCKLNLFNHVVCVEEELKRRMDFVEEQIEALELAFAQSVGNNESTYVPPDPLQMKRTIRVLIDDLERVNKLVSI